MKTAIPILLYFLFFASCLASPLVTSKTEVITTNGVTYVCERPIGALSAWYWDFDLTIPPRGCTLPYNGAPGIIMLNAYRSGGRENVHWIYTNDKNDPRCLENWAYNAPDGVKVIADTVADQLVDQNLLILPFHSPRAMLILNFLISISLLSNMVAGTNSTAYRNASLSSSIEEDRAFEMCTLPTNGLPQWCYEDCKYGYNLCSKEKGSDKRWAMLNGYRSGGKEKYHWKYTTNKNDLECLQNWTYYASNGKTKYGTIVGRVTQMRDRYKKLWCALPVYRRNGKRGLQWDFCSACPSS